MHQVWIEKASASEPLLKCRNVAKDDVKTRAGPGALGLV